MAKKGGLGMGLDALFNDNSTDSLQGKQTLRLSEIEPNKMQPRRTFDDTSISTLADSIRDHGLLQPLLVRPLANGGYQLVAGERRWRACKMLGMSEVPAVIRELSDKETMQVALIENVIRENLNPIEEAQAYRELMDDYDMTQEEVAKTVGKSRSVVANAVRVLTLSENVQDFLKRGDLTMGHGRCLVGLPEETQLELAEKAIKAEMTVRELEKAVSNLNKEPAEEKQPVRDSYFKEMEISLKNELSRKVKVSFSGKKGVLQLEFYDKDDLRDLAGKLTLGNMLR